MWLAAQRAGHEIGRDQAARLMRRMEICGVTRRRKVFTTRPDPDAQRAPDLVNRNFTADRPDALWVTDLTYVPTRTGMAYVCFIVDAFSRRIVGWRAATNMKTQMVLDALEMARRVRGSRRLIGPGFRQAQPPVLEANGWCRPSFDKLSGRLVEADAYSAAMDRHAVRVSDEGAVRRLTFCRPDAYNTITPQLRDELGAALDGAQRDRNVRVILLDAEGPAFCAGYGLDWSTAQQADDADRSDRAWDTAADLHVIGTFASTWAKLHESTKPTVAAVQGWCIAGGTNIVFNAHLIVAAESARFGYPPSRVWGVPEAPWTWVARMGVQQARRYMLTGDEFTAAEALDMGVVLEVVPDDELAQRSTELAQRIAQVPANQLEMITLALNAVANHQFDPPASRLLGTIFDGVARHSQEGNDFVQRSSEVGFRQAVRERDRPFRDYGERPQP